MTNLPISRRSLVEKPQARPARNVHRDAALVPVVLVTCVGLLTWVWALQFGTYGPRFWAVPLSLTAFLAVQVAVPRVRWRHDGILSPGNLALILFAVQLVVVPILLVTTGPATGTLAIFPADVYVNSAMLLQALAYVGYAVGFALPGEAVHASRLLPAPRVTAATAVAFMALGGLGIALQFPSIGALYNYFAGQGNVFPQPGSATLGEAAASFLRPFLSYGVIVLWTARIARRGPGRRISPGELGLALFAVLASATYDYNRASVVVPILAMITAYGMFGRGLHLGRLTAGLVLLAVVAYQFGEYRGEYTATRGGQISAAQAGLDGDTASFDEVLQGYGNAPQFWATVLEDVDRAGFRGGDTLLGSTLLPVPVLGKPYRAESGPRAYNELVYGKSDVEDQILGFGAELYWNFGAPAVVVGYLLLGLVVRRFDDRVRHSVDPLAAYTWTYCGIWVALLTINSISVLAQIIVYFVWPAVAMWVIARTASIRRPEVGT